MKKPHVLNRPMYNLKGNSAYGRGIASNLVTEKQRIRYNSGGRVGASLGLWARAAPYAKKGYDATKALGPKISQWWKTPYTGIGSGEIGIAKKGVEYGAPLAVGTAKKMAQYPMTTLGAGWLGSKWLGGDDKEEVEEKTTETIDWDPIQKDGVSKNMPTDEKITTTETDKIDLSPSEKAGLQASMWMSGGAGALDPKNKDVADVVRGFLLGAGKAGMKGVDPSKEKEYRLWGDAQAKRDTSKLEKQEELYKKRVTDPQLRITARVDKGEDVVTATEGVMLDKRVPRVGGEANKKNTKQWKKNKDSLGSIVFNEDSGVYMVRQKRTGKWVPVRELSEVIKYYQDGQIG